MGESNGRRTQKSLEKEVAASQSWGKKSGRVKDPEVGKEVNLKLFGGCRTVGFNIDQKGDASYSKLAGDRILGRIRGK